MPGLTWQRLRLESVIAEIGRQDDGRAKVAARQLLDQQSALTRDMSAAASGLFGR